MTNFQRLITDLTRKCGWTEKQIAGYCGISQGNVSRLKLTKGATPSHPTGQALIKLHEKEMARWSHI